MKKTFALFIAVFTMMSVMGQNNEKTHFINADLQQKSIKQVLEMVSPRGLNQDFKKHPEFSKIKLKNRSVLEFKQVLDSMDNTSEGVVYYRERYTYNLQGNATLIEELNLNDENILAPSSRHEYSFDVTGNMMTYIYSQWEEFSNDWFIYFKMEYAYSNGLLMSGNMFTWNTDLNDWQLDIKEEYSYDAQGRLTSVVSLIDNNGTWEQMYKEEVSYNAGGYPYLWMEYYWNASTGSWIPDAKDEDFFDANGNVELNLESIMDEMTSEWIDVYKTEYIYDANHQMLTETYSEIDEATMQWMQLGKDEYTYDEYGNVTVDISSGWYEANWQLWGKEELTFDYTVPSDEVVYPNVYGDYDYTHKLTGVMDYFWSDSWVDDEQFVFYYSEKNINEIADISSAEISVYPNPSAGIFNVEISDFAQKYNISVLDFAGRILMQEEVNNAANEYKTTLNLSKYGKGVYFLMFSCDMKNKHQKIVIQ